MRLKIDENLPQDLGSALNANGHEAKTVHDEKLSGCSDDEIWAAVQREARFLITQDLDFSDIRKFAPGTHSGILLVRLRSPSRSNLIRKVIEVFADEDVETWSGCFVIATELKVRVIRA